MKKQAGAGAGAEQCQVAKIQNCQEVDNVFHSVSLRCEHFKVFRKPALAQGGIKILHKYSYQSSSATFILTE